MLLYCRFKMNVLCVVCDSCSGLTYFRSSHALQGFRTIIINTVCDIYTIYGLTVF